MSNDHTIIMVTGSRELPWDCMIDVHYILLSTIEEFPESNHFSLVVGDCSTGADSIVIQSWNRWRRDEKFGQILEKPYVFRADWNRHGKGAGPLRNAEMAQCHADILLAFYKRGAGNRGTNNCVAAAEREQIFVRKYHFE